MCRRAPSPGAGSGGGDARRGDAFTAAVSCSLDVTAGLAGSRGRRGATVRNPSTFHRAAPRRGRRRPYRTFGYCRGLAVGVGVRADDAGRRGAWIHRGGGACSGCPAANLTRRFPRATPPVRRDARLSRMFRPSPGDRGSKPVRECPAPGRSLCGSTDGLRFDRRTYPRRRCQRALVNRPRGGRRSGPSAVAPAPPAVSVRC